MIKKNNVSELSMLKNAEMDIIKGGSQSSLGTCDICHFTKSEKARKELAANTPSNPTPTTNLTLV